jgi:large subunit ribosomal protein L5
MVTKTAVATTPRLKALYKDSFVKELQAELELTNVHQVPKLEKIVVSVGIGKNTQLIAWLRSLLRDLRFVLN